MPPLLNHIVPCSTYATNPIGANKQFYGLHTGAELINAVKAILVYMYNMLASMLTYGWRAMKGGSAEIKMIDYKYIRYC